MGSDFYLEVLQTGFLPFGHLNFVLYSLWALRPCDPRTDASDHIFVLGIFILLLLLVVVVVLLGELLGELDVS